MNYIHVWGSQFFLPSTRSPHIQQQYGKSQNMHICCLPYFVCKNTNFLTDTYQTHDFLEIGVLFSVLHYFISWTPNKSSFFFREILKKRTIALATLLSQIYRSHDTHLQYILDLSASQLTRSLVCSLYPQCQQVFSVFFFCFH